MNNASLRLRLFIIIVIPLFIASILVGLLRYNYIKTSSSVIFDSTLTAVALAIARDVMQSRGDALSISTRDLLKESSGGVIFYHVNGPDGVFVTGYAYPPRLPDDIMPQEGVAQLFDGIYNSNRVRVIRLKEKVLLNQISGFSVVTVWQKLENREAYFLKQATHLSYNLLLILFTLMVVVWFGVRLGLRPLLDLETAIRLRSPNNLKMIKRKVPKEVKGIVTTLNRLFSMVEDSNKAKDNFLADAAHQLRNPIASLLILAEATRDAKNHQDQKSRASNLVEATLHVSRLAEQMLFYERLKGLKGKDLFKPEQLNLLLEKIKKRNLQKLADSHIELVLNYPIEPCWLESAPIFIAEAIENLIDNSIKHGGEDNHLIEITLRNFDHRIEIHYRDYGKGIPESQQELIFERFQSGYQSQQGCGLGLAIVREVCRQHGGDIILLPTDKGVLFELWFAK